VVNFSPRSALCASASAARAHKPNSTHNNEHIQHTLLPATPCLIALAAAYASHNIAELNTRSKHKKQHPSPGS
jgi:hypothetical protein